MRVFKKKRKDKESGLQKISKAWTVEFRDHLGTTRRISAYKDRRISEAYGRTLDTLVEHRKAGEALHGDLRAWIETMPNKKKKRLEEWGLLTQAEVSAGLGIDEQLKGWRTHMEAKDDCKKHINQSIAKTLKIWRDCCFLSFNDVCPVKVEEWLNKQKPTMSATTRNHYLRSIRAFLNWAKKVSRISNNPLDFIAFAKQNTCIEDKRRAMSNNEVIALLEFVIGGSRHHGLAGYERVLVYRIAIETGLRWSEIFKLTRSDVLLNKKRSCIRCRAENAKNKKEYSQPLKEALSKDLETYMQSTLAMPSTKLFSNMWQGKGADMLRKDMSDARSDTILKGLLEVDDNFLVPQTLEGKLDFHSLRHTFGTNLANAKVYPKVAQILMRHSDINLTMNRYTHESHDTKVAAIDALPDISNYSYAEATGTDDTFTNSSNEISQKKSPRFRPIQESQTVINGRKQADESNGKTSDIKNKNACKPLNTGVTGVNIVVPSEGIEPPARRLEICCSIP